ncbi:hypothetical protein EQO05_13015 [Methanosarcina sp. MSH10X1]|uniref:hypothetical protein n=1 Tax=Methanosarcina sp. MSH10X1 TaxID=2507075 RepID=UPI000FFB8351|nr:hypothetical protein [Methanosarcina sp. MSH10X1]RXA16954.1 hypothetical protein EQO05_13015 [Methanosarcina sp. MSH10X1]
MGRDTGKALGGPAIALLAVGAVINVILFYLMFRFADEENLFMVLLTAALIGVISLGVAKGLVHISRRNYGK